MQLIKLFNATPHFARLPEQGIGKNNITFARVELELTTSCGCAPAPRQSKIYLDLQIYYDMVLLVLVRAIKC